MTYERALLVDVVIHHGRKDIRSCYCGWAELGASHAEHVADAYEAAVARRRLVALETRPADAL